MKYAVKNKKKVVKAYPLGANHPMEDALIAEGKIRLNPDGSYELFSQEAVNGQGQIAHAGDYFKVDDAGFPYPNGREFFLANHTHIGGDEYEQANKPQQFWEATDKVTEEVQWLIDNERLTLKPEITAHFFNAFLWGADLSADSDAKLVFYGVKRDADGKIIDIDFNFVAKAEFAAAYTIL